MARYKLILAYDGTNYAGWQQQKGQLTIEGVLRCTFFSIFNTDLLYCSAASRTDAGVHALGAVILCIFNIPLPNERVLKVWNDGLPPTIVIRSLESVSSTFSPWRNVRYKEYNYHIALQRPLPMLAPYVWHPRAPLDIEKFKNALELFVGTHDFTAFASADDARECMVRTVDSISIEHMKKVNLWRVKVIGSKFVRHMVRRIVGASVYVASAHNVSPVIITTALATSVRVHELPTAPAQGLLLRKIIYE